MKRTALALALILAASAALFAQDAKPAAKPGDAPAIHSKTLWEQIKEGGWVMFPISAVSILTFYLIGDGFIRITSPKKMLPAEQVETVKNFFRSGKYVEAYHYCKAQDSAFANVARVAISCLGEGKTATEEAIVAEMTKENSRIQTFVSYLSVIGVCAPMIGLLGTVTGMIRAFAVLGSSGIGDPSSLSAGDWRSAGGHRFRPLHRHPRLRRLLLVAQPRHQGAARHPGHPRPHAAQDAL